MAAKPITSHLPIVQAHTAPPKSALRRNRAYTALFAIRIIQILIGAALLAFGVIVLAATAAVAMASSYDFSSSPNLASYGSDPELADSFAALDAELAQYDPAEAQQIVSTAFSVAIAVLAATGGLVTSLGCLGVALPIAWLVYLARPECRAKAHTHARSAGADVAADAVLASIWLLLLVTSIIALAVLGSTCHGLEVAGVALYAVCAGLYIASAALTNRLRTAGFFAAQLQRVHQAAGAAGLNSV